LRWGSYRGRYLAGLALILVGAVVVQLTSAYSLMVLPLGLLLHITGWCIVPGIGRRRVSAAAASALMMVVLLNGALATAFLAIPLAAWLFVRQRPLVSYVVLAIPLLASIPLAQLFPDYGWGAVVLPIAGALLAGAAWLGRSLAAMSGRSPAATR
jgi:hypothetical protein